MLNNDYISTNRTLNSMRAPAPCSEFSLSAHRVTRTSTNVWLRTTRARSQSMPSCRSSEVSPAAWKSVQRGNDIINHKVDISELSPCFYDDTLPRQEVIVLYLSRMEVIFCWSHIEQNSSRDYADFKWLHMTTVFENIVSCRQNFFKGCLGI